MRDAPLTEAARLIGVSPSTLRRWAREGAVPLTDGRWTPSAIAHARIVSRLRARSHSLSEIRRAAQSGRLAHLQLENLFPAPGPGVDLAEAAKRSGLEPALIERIWTSIGFPAHGLERLQEEDLELLCHLAAALEAGFPLVALLQLVRVYGHALAQIADAEVRLFHLYVHEPLIREGMPGLEMAAEMEGLAGVMLPLASPVMTHLHRAFLGHFVEQDVVGHLEDDSAEALDPGRLRAAIAFVDLAGYTRLTEEAGEEQALDLVERFQEAVETTLPDDARVIKTIGDEVMVVGSDSARLCEWAVGFQRMPRERPLPRIGLHCGAVLYRDGDYYGRAVNLASRVGARAAGGEVLVTRPVVETAGHDVAFERVGEVRLKGFTGSTELFLAGRAAA